MKTSTSLTLTLLLIAASAPLAAQDAKPGPEHQKLAARAGTWNATVEMMGMDGKPTKSQGISKVTVGCGGLWIIEDFQGQLGGGPFHGHGMTGYDATKGKYVGAWVDSMTPMLMTLEGTADKDGKVTTMMGMAPGMDGKPVQHRMVTTTKDANTYTFEMFTPGPDGKEMKVLTITYVRAMEKAPEKPAK